MELFYNDPNGTKVQIPLTNIGIAWWTDKHVKFKNPGAGEANQNLTAVFQGVTTNLCQDQLSFSHHRTFTSLLLVSFDFRYNEAAELAPTRLRAGRRCE